MLYHAEITLPIVKEYTSFMASDNHIPSPRFAASIQCLCHNWSKIIACQTNNWCDRLRSFQRGHCIRKDGPGIAGVWGLYASGLLQGMGVKCITSGVAQSFSSVTMSVIMCWSLELIAGTGSLSNIWTVCKNGVPSDAMLLSSFALKFRQGI